MRYLTWLRSQRWPGGWANCLNGWVAIAVAGWLVGWLAASNELRGTPRAARQAPSSAPARSSAPRTSSAAARRAANHRQAPRIVLDHGTIHAAHCTIYGIDPRLAPAFHDKQQCIIKFGRACYLAALAGELHLTTSAPEKELQLQVYGKLRCKPANASDLVRPVHVPATHIKYITRALTL